MDERIRSYRSPMLILKFTVIVIVIVIFLMGLLNDKELVRIIADHDHAIVKNKNESESAVSAVDTSGMNIIHKASLLYSKHLQANQGQIEFNANVTLTAIGEICFEFGLVPNTSVSAQTCPFPSIRLRLSGAALVNVRLRQRRWDDATQWLDGCNLLPVPGTYYVDANLIHCHMNVNFMGENRKFRRKSGTPVYPDLNVIVTPHKVEMPPFYRTNTSMLFSHQSPINAYSHHAWVFAPLCPNSTHTISERCSKLKSPPFMTTTFQLDEWLHHQNYKSFKVPEFHKRWDDYMWLPVDPRNGSIDFPTEPMSHEYTPIPSFLSPEQQHQRGDTYNQTILFVGDSHARYLKNQVSQIYYNLTYGHDGCYEDHEPPPDLNDNQTRFGYILSYFPSASLQEILLQEAANYYDKFVVTIGHWDAGFPRMSPTTSFSFIESLKVMIAVLENFAKPGAEIYITTVNQHPMGRKALNGRDWRVPPLIDEYNDKIWSQVTVDYPITGPTSFRFRDFNRTYLLDNTDIMDPTWDAASDFNHPCRYGSRPMAVRVLELLQARDPFLY